MSIEKFEVLSNGKMIKVAGGAPVGGTNLDRILADLDELEGYPTGLDGERLENGKHMGSSFFHDL